VLVLVRALVCLRICVRLFVVGIGHAGHEETVNVLLRYKANVNSVSPLGHTALYWSTLRRQYDITKLLLEHGADPNLVSLHGSASGHTMRCVLVAFVVFVSTVTDIGVILLLCSSYISWCM